MLTAAVDAASGAGVDALKAVVLNVVELTAVGVLLEATTGADDVEAIGT